MTISFFPDGYSPMPPDETEIEELEVVVYPDRIRVFVHCVVTPFQQRPNLLITATRDDGRIRSELNIIETMHHDMEFTMHLRTNGLDPAGEYTLSAELFFETRVPAQSTRTARFSVPASDAL